MDIRQANETDTRTVREITHRTITAVYPHYYPAGTVTFFLKHHSAENISADIAAGRVFLLYDDRQEAVGTVTVKGNEICRLFVLPEFQGQGFGKELIGYAETEIGRDHSEITVDASLPAKPVYLKLGYKETEFRTEKTYFGDHLCYDVMKKNIR